MLDFINKLFSSGFMSIFSAVLLASWGLLEYFLIGRKRKKEVKQDADPKDVQEILLGMIAYLKTNSKQMQLEESFTRKIIDIEKEVENAGAVTVNLSSFQEKQIEKIQEINSYVNKNFKRINKQNKLKFILICLFINIVIYIFTGFALKSISFDPGRLAVWAFFGLFTTLLISVFLYFYASLFLFTMNKLAYYLIYVSRSSTFCTNYGVTKLFIYGLIILSFLFYSNLYKYIYPTTPIIFSGFANNLVNTIVVVTEVVAAVGGYLQLYEFAEKRFIKARKLDKDNKQEF